MKYNILIADDVEINRKLIGAILKGNKDLILHEVEDGKRALQFIDENDIDLLILDLMMPFLDGFTVLNELKSSEKNKDIPVIVYSAVNEIDSIQRALELGAYDYFHKPLTREQMSVV